jgi:phospholipid/cholesterol/gamma-HCH transport system ATP-binding protein
MSESGTSERSATPPVLVVAGLSKSYGSKRVLEQIDFELAAKECLVVLGRSGSGKSVLLRQLNGLEKPDSGSVRFADTEITSLAEEQLFTVRRRIGMLFQSGALFDSLNVIDNVAFPLREHTDLGADEVAAKASEKLAMVRLEGSEEKMPADLSGGMRKRVALARSLALDPQLMLYDEPTTGLDPMTSATIGSLLHQVQEKIGVASVVITHDLSLARRIADRIAYLAGGRFRFIGDWQAAEHSDDPELAAFLEAREEDEHAA